MTDNANAVLTVTEVAKILRLSRNAAYQAIACGDVPSIRVGRKILIPRAPFDAMLAAPPPDRALSVSMQNKIRQAAASLENAIARANDVLEKLASVTP